MLSDRHGPGIRTRVLLLASLILIVAATTCSSLFIIRNKLRQRAREILAQELQNSVATFQDLEARRLTTLERENALLASLPSLKALMTTSDARTIADGALDFWKTSGNDLFALADADGTILAANTVEVEGDVLKRDLQNQIEDPAKHYLISGGHMYEYSVRPLYFGSEKTGTLLGHVISGYAIDQLFLVEIGRGAGAEAAFVTGNTLAVTTLPGEKQGALQHSIPSLSHSSELIIRAGRERFLTISRDLTAEAGFPLRLVIMKSFDATDRAEREINRLVFATGMLAMLAGAVLMLLLARMVTRPLEQLATGVRAFGEGNPRYSLPRDGTQEVRYLSHVFAQMRDEIQKTNRALLESERLATIGRMASSVSHDLRHYLAAVYANAEFLASPLLPSNERAELFEEIRLAVNGTTDMLDTLLIFGRTGAGMQRLPMTMESLLDRAVALVRTHPDTEGVTLRVEKSSDDTTAALDAKQMERALYNLLLNACQSARQSTGGREVVASVSSDQTTVSVSITDSGPGVAEGIRESLFDPFVSQGKQKGTGLGLTLAWSVAREHGGDVKLVSSRSGRTIFRLMVSRQMSPAPTTPRSTLLTP
ncbi:ATP-binding protein [Edaphobacter modestus]|uniref:histidine kinase n=1 Tax=Edaphobacter modestus TaxID=388466 RepID=A0A4V6MFV9_9BACT|nr:ATP-binding protein [Edaphobacter modestus]RZU42346.1 signal transduction histidine kinase [Edaphobacter modestus]